MFSEDFLHRAKDAWSWWSGEMISFVPAPMKKLLGLGKSMIVLREEELGFEVLRLGTDGKPERPAETYPSLAGAIAGLSAARGEDDEIVIALPEEKGLTVQTRYPADVAGQLAAIIRFDVDKLTPFPADQVHMGHQITGRVDKDILVQISVLPKASTRAIFSELQAAGLKANRLVLGDGTPLKKTNLLADETKPGAKRPLFAWMMPAAGAGALALLAVPAISATLEVGRAKTELLAHERDALRLLSLHRDAATAQEARTLLLSAVGDDTEALNALRDLTLILPDTAYLTRLSWQKGALELSGYAANAAALIETFEGVSWVETAAFEGPIVNDERRGLERFTVKITARDEQP